MAGRGCNAAFVSSVLDVGAREVVGETDRTDDQSESSLADEDALSRGMCGDAMMSTGLLFLERDRSEPVRLSPEGREGPPGCRPS